MRISHASSRRNGFSLVELLVSMTILSALLLMFVGLLDQTQKSWDLAQSQVSQFRSARLAYDIITKNLSQATLNAYYDQVDYEEEGEDGYGIPDEYTIASELHFRNMYADDLPLNMDAEEMPGHAIFFQAPLGVADHPAYIPLSNLMNARGYYVMFTSDEEYRPPFFNTMDPPREPNFRYRLMEFLPPTEKNEVYIDHQEDVDKAVLDQRFQKWYRNQDALQTYSRPLADNIVALVLSPREPVADAIKASDTELAERKSFESIAPKYVYDSEEGYPLTTPKKERRRHVLPPLVKVTMVAIDEVSAMRLEEKYGEESAYLGEFVNVSNWLKDPEKYQSDLNELVQAFNEANRDETNGLTIRYKVFSSTVPILASKWSVAARSSTTP